MSARVVAVGQRLAGDDAVALEVLRLLRAEDPPLAADLLETSDPSRLVEWACGVDDVVVVDAIVDGGPPGRVVAMPADSIAAAPARPVSTHGLRIVEALGLAGILHPEAVAKRVTVVGVTIADHRVGARLSAEVAAGVAPAIAAVRRAIEGPGALNRGRR